MKKYYQSVMTSDRDYDEWVNYEGYSKEQALKATAERNSKCMDKHCHAETREYKLPDDRAFEELSDDEQCDVLSCYDVID